MKIISKEEKDCYCCKHATFKYYMSDIDWDITGCKKYGLYDDDARFKGKCGEEGKDYIGKTKFDWFIYDTKRWIFILWNNFFFKYEFWKKLCNSDKQLKRRK